VDVSSGYEWNELGKTETVNIELSGGRQECKESDLNFTQILLGRKGKSGTGR